MDMETTPTPIHILISNDFKLFLTQASQNNYKRGWIYHMLRKKYDEDVLKMHLPRHTKTWWRAQA